MPHMPPSFGAFTKPVNISATAARPFTTCPAGSRISTSFGYCAMSRFQSHLFSASMCSSTTACGVARFCKGGSAGACAATVTERSKKRAMNARVMELSSWAVGRAKARPLRQVLLNLLRHRIRREAVHDHELFVGRRVDELRAPVLVERVDRQDVLQAALRHAIALAV